MKRVTIVVIMIFVMFFSVSAEAKKISKKQLKKLGTFTLTAYSGDGITSTGKKPRPNHTVAVDPRVIPYGSKVVIRGKTYVAEDCGGGIKGKSIDVYFATDAECVRFGRQKAVVYLVKKKKPVGILKRIRRFLNENIKNNISSISWGGFVNRANIVI